MKLNNFLTIALVACMMTAFMSFTSIVTNDDSEVKFEETTHQFSQVPQGTPVTTKFKFTNNSNKPLILKSVQASCGCTTPDYTREPIMAGATGEITVTYNAANMGKFKKSITVTTNIEETPIILYIEGEVIAK
jgi:hypothetical protein